jgi:hypothetical protein
MRGGWNKGKKMPDGHGNKLSGKNHFRSIKVICEGVIFDTITQASNFYQITKPAMTRRIKSTTKTWDDFFYFDENIHKESDFISYNKNLKSKYIGRQDKNPIGKQGKSRKVSCDGIIFNSVTEASIFFDTYSVTIIKRLKSDADEWKDYFYIDD